MHGKPLFTSIVMFPPYNKGVVDTY